MAKSQNIDIQKNQTEPAADDVNNKPKAFTLDRVDLQNSTVTITFRADVLGTITKLFETASSFITGKMPVQQENKQPAWIELEAMGTKLRTVGGILFGEIDVLKHLAIAEIIIDPIGKLLVSNGQKNYLRKIDMQKRVVTITFPVGVLETITKLFEHTSSYVTGKMPVAYEDKKPTWITLEMLGGRLRTISGILSDELSINQHLGIAETVIGVDGDALKDG